MTGNWNRRRFLAASLAAGSIPFIGAPSARAQATGVLTFGLSSYPPSFMAWAQNGTAAGTLKLMMHRGLLSYAPDGAMRGELAESWGVEDGGWTFHLREATFHDGSPVTSADVRWNIEQVAAKDSTAYFGGQFQDITNIDTPDDKTIRLTTARPIATLPSWFAHYNMPILPEGADPENSIGAGPFKLDERERGVSMTLSAYDGYYKSDLPKLAGAKVIVYADENLRVAALEAGDVDLIEYVPWQSMKGIEGNSDLALDTVDGPFMYLTFNGSRPPFNDARVRKAVGHAIKREDIVAAAFYGRGAPLAHLPISDKSEFFNPDLAEGWAYDPDLAKKLLAEAGFADGFSCTLLSTAQYGMHQSTAEVVQAYLSTVGINATLALPDWSTRVQQGNAGQYDLAVMGTSADSNDPDGLSNIIDGTLPPSFSRSLDCAVSGVDEALAEGRAEFDPARRKEIYHRMEAAAIESAPIVGLAWRSQGYAMNNKVSGFTNMPGQLTFYSGVTLEETELG
jgi:peptide/nickel transport system substrate-binding protein